MVTKDYENKFPQTKISPYAHPPLPIHREEEEECTEEWHKCDGSCWKKRIPCNDKCAEGWCLKKGNCINTRISTLTSNKFVWL